jgi:TRAP-type C4-dicarboxylate transport system substrate-binding protein
MNIKKTFIYALTTVFLFTAVGESFAKTLKASHQWPGTKRKDGKFDVRHEMVQIIADEIKKANVGIDIRIYPAKSLYKPKEQWKPMTTGQLDISAFPLAYAAKFHPEFDITLMPGMVKNHKHALRVNKSPMMKKIRKIINDAGVIVLSDAWLAGGFVSKKNCITSPDTVKGQVFRAAGKAFNQMLAAAGAGIQKMPSSEIYNGLQTGVLTGANTSSGSFVSYRIYEQVKCATPPGKFGLWFMYEPILMSKKSFDSLNKKQQKALMAAGKVAEKYMTKEAAGLDTTMEKAYKKAGVKLAYMTQKDFDAWLAIAKKSSYKNFAEKVPNGQKLIDMALAVK